MVSNRTGKTYVFGIFFRFIGFFQILKVFLGFSMWRKWNTNLKTQETYHSTLSVFGVEKEGFNANPGKSGGL